MPNSLLSDIPLTQLERLKFIERQLMWGRAFKARMLMERFGVSRPQVVTDLKQYTKLYPENVAPYDPTQKAYTPAATFTPRLIELSDDAGVESSSLIHVPLIQKNVNQKYLTRILQAIQMERGIELIYASITNPLGTKRVIYPTRMISAANRLHFRGYCTLRNEYRDFVVSRCLTMPKLIEANTDLPKDALWLEQIAIKIQPNPYLVKEGQDLIEREYEGQLSEAFNLSKAMLHYFLVDNNLPSTKEQLAMAKRNPWSYPIVVEFTDAIYALLENYR